MIDRKKILDRIKKLLRMADDVSSPNEAAIAARRAERLMAEHNLSHADMLTADLSSESFDEQHHGPAYRAYPRHLVSLAIGVAEYTDCRVIWGWKHGTIKRQLVFQGEVGDLEICKYLWLYLSRTVDRLYKESGVSGVVGPRTSFKKGCVAEINATLRRMKADDAKADAVASDGKSVILVDKKQALMDAKFGKCRYGKHRASVSSNRAYGAGREAGAGVSIRKAVNTSAGRKRLT